MIITLQNRARFKGESARPNLWPDHAWMPCFGPQGSILGNTSPALFDMVTGNPGVAIPSSSYPTDYALAPNSQLGNLGWALVSSESSGYSGGINTRVNPYASAVGMTFEILLKTGTAVNTNQIIAEDGSDYNADCFYLAIWSQKFQFEIFTGNYSVVDSATIANNTHYHIICSWSGAGGGTNGYPVIAVNGVYSTGSTQRLGSLSASPNAPLTLFGRPNAGASAIVNTFAPLKNGSNISFARVYKRCLTVPEQIALFSDPLAPFERKQLYFIPNVESAAALYEGSFSSSFSISPSLSGQLGVGGGLTSTAGSATYANAGKEGKQGPLTTTLAALAQALAGKEGKQGPISINTAALIQALTGGAGNKGALAAQTIVNTSLSGNAGNKGALAATISLSALFSQAALFEGTVSAALAAIAPAFAGNAGNLGTLLTTISAASAIAAITGNAGYLQSVLTDLALQETGQIGSTGTAALTISTGADMSGKLGVSAEIAATLADLGAYLVEIIVGDKIHRIVIATTTGQAVILTATGTITFN
jgi:hypothetical protein